MLLHTITRTMVGDDSNVTGRRSQAQAESTNERSFWQSSEPRRVGPNDLR